MRWFVLAALTLAATPAVAQQRGQLISAEPMVGTQARAMQVWRIRYWTANDRGQPLAVTGMVAAPLGPATATPRPVIAWTHGTWGIAESCAPSLSAKFFTVTPALDAVREGYVVVAPDYPGLGSAGPHPYLVGTITARSVLDAVRAARSIKGADAGSEFAVWGESQGGHAAIWTGQLARDEAPELKLVGIAAGAPATDLGANLRRASDLNARVLLIAFTADSWSRYYNVPLVIGRKGTPAIIRKMAAKCLDLDRKPKLGAILGILTLRRDLRSVDLAVTAPWSSMVAANSVAPTASYPVIIAQTEGDPLVSAAVTREWAKKLCARRVQVTWVGLAGGDHATTAKQSSAATIRWIGDRFAGKPAPTDCGRI